MSELADVLFFLENADSITLSDLSDEIARMLLKRGQANAEMPLRTGRIRREPTGDRR